MPESASSRVTKSRPRLSLLSGNWECINSLCFASRTVIVKSNKRGSETEKRFSVYHKKMQSYIFEPNLMFQAELTYFLHILHTLSYTVTKLNASPAALSVPLPCNSHELCSLFSLSLSLSLSLCQEQKAFLEDAMEVETVDKLFFFHRILNLLYSAVRKNVVKGCVSRSFNHATFHHVFWPAEYCCYGSFLSTLSHQCSHRYVFEDRCIVT